MRSENGRAGAYFAAAFLVALVGPTWLVAQVGPRTVLLDNSVLAVRGGNVEEVLTLPEGGMATRLEPLTNGWIAGGMQGTATGVDLFLIARQGEEVQELESPAGDGAEWRGRATPLVAKGVLEGLLWLEGDRHNRLAVRAAARNETGWGPAEVVSVPGPGSQVALSGVILEDGSWLAVWTWVDGEGDAETVWSRRDRSGSWTEPARIHEDNQTHDVEPALAAVEGGAIVVWTAFDGDDYRMRRARFDGRSWTASNHFGGRGASGPVLAAEPGAGRMSLIYTTVAPSIWSIVEFDARGKPLAVAAVERDPRDGGPVFLNHTANDEAELVWPSFRPDFPERREPLSLGPWAPDPGPEK